MAENDRIGESASNQDTELEESKEDREHLDSDQINPEQIVSNHNSNTNKLLGFNKSRPSPSISGSLSPIKSRIAY